MNRFRTAIFFALLTVFLVSCSSATSIEPTPIPATETASPSATPVPPTETVEPTATTTPSGVPITMEDIVGVWRAQYHLSFSEDGVLKVADPNIGSVDNEDAVFAKDSFALDEGIITLRGISGSCKGLTGTYKAWLTSEGNLKFELISEDCAGRRGPMSATHRPLP